ncbi:type II toxin-antitoxin system HicA family toxin [Pleurocapsa sp. PCC 7319]|uniref:type II toxin-antitoxin system HicA family toxin n=1 Tax=Pleurocapsa sp. PCC 7319 TaxID=118161 RepID=UPI0003473A4D|nr:type II toxin-antitoxin system HicA family toxin [Pleurocapsa sp. PCC 7319]
MGRLAGFSYREVTRKLRKLGFEFYRTGKGDHEIWINSTTNIRTTIPHHGEVREGILRNILKQARVEVEDFLKA